MEPEPTVDQFSDSSDEEVLEPDELYDDGADDADERWVDRHLRPETTRKGTRKGPETDAVLNCPCCFTTLCMDCQRHVKYRNQFRAMFTTNCVVKTHVKVLPSGQPAAAPASAQPPSSTEAASAGPPQPPQQPPAEPETQEAAAQGEAGKKRVTFRPPSDAEGGQGGGGGGGGREDEEDVVYPVCCESCGTQVGVQDQEEVVHFFNVIAS